MPLADNVFNNPVNKNILEFIKRFSEDVTNQVGANTKGNVAGKYLKKNINGLFKAIATPALDNMSKAIIDHGQKPEFRLVPKPNSWVGFIDIDKINFKTYDKLGMRPYDTDNVKIIANKITKLLTTIINYRMVEINDYSTRVKKYLTDLQQSTVESEFVMYLYQLPAIYDELRDHGLTNDYPTSPLINPNMEIDIEILGNMLENNKYDELLNNISMSIATITKEELKEMVDSVLVHDFITDISKTPSLGMLKSKIEKYGVEYISGYVYLLAGLKALIKQDDTNVYRHIYNMVNERFGKLLNIYKTITERGLLVSRIVKDEDNIEFYVNNENYIKYLEEVTRDLKPLVGAVIRELSIKNLIESNNVDYKNYIDITIQYIKENRDLLSKIRDEYVRTKNLEKTLINKTRYKAFYLFAFDNHLGKIYGAQNRPMIEEYLETLSVDKLSNIDETALNIVKMLEDSNFNIIVNGVEEANAYLQDPSDKLSLAYAVFKYTVLYMLSNYRLV